MSVELLQVGGDVKGVLSGFDRIVFKGTIQPLLYEAGVAQFLRSKGVLNKDYKDWMQEQTRLLIGDAETFSQTQTGSAIIPIRSSLERKEDIARKRQQDLEIEQGLIGVWSALESCLSFKARFSAAQGFPQIQREWTKCKHLYFYFDHADYGFLNVRLQTWFPYHLQIAMNGREWLRRSLEKAGIGFARCENKFLHIDDMAAAQRDLRAQLDVRWVDLLNGFLPLVFPRMGEILGPHLQPYWTLWQSEWATDYIFTSAEAMHPMAERLLLHAFLTGTTPQVLRYFNRPLTAAGRPRANLAEAVESRLLAFGDGLRVRHWVGGNSVKVYTEQNVLRTETTINDPGRFKVARHAQGEDPEQPKRHLPLRKSVSDISLRARISEEVNQRVLASLSSLQVDATLGEQIQSVCRRQKRNGRQVRALDLLGKDRKLLCLLADPCFAIEGMSNLHLRERLSGEDGWRGRTAKQQSARTSRMIRMLRDHGLLRKIRKRNRYILSAYGLKLTLALCSAYHASTQRLMEMAA
jgi:hypothetical protein